MGINSVGRANALDIAVSGLRAETARMNLIANNIANASTSRTADGKPYRREELVLSTSDGLSGVNVEQVTPDLSTDFKRVYQPGHPDAGTDGYVAMPNVELPTEMMHLVTASRAYQANVAVLKRYGEISDATLELLR
ncbi:MAG: flagellar basal body rod protein FlgC [Phycisphaerae bacterium]|jgi:flagellar basal-body rod protein FlgC